MSAFNCFRRDFTFKRLSGGAYVNGKWIKGTPTDIIIKASLQPLTGEELKQLPEGRRTDQTYKMYSSIKLRTVKTDNPDYTTIDGNKFEVIEIEPSQNGIINHYKIVIGKVNEIDGL